METSLSVSAGVVNKTLITRNLLEYEVSSLDYNNFSENLVSIDK